MAIPISNVTRRVVFAASGTGPYAFTFEILANTDIAVYKDDVLLTLTTDYTVTINANGTGSVTLVANPTGATQIAIVGNRTIARSSDFVTGGDFFANTLNDELDQQTIFAQQNQEGLGRALQAPQTDPTTIDMTLPRASVRANKTLAFDSNGDPTTGEVIGDNRGNWASGTAYNKRDIVKDTSTGDVYYCNTSHTSSGSQPISTNADSAKWDLFVDNSSAAAAQAAAEAAQAAAETAETNAAASASAASTSASNASTSATNASNSATAASGSASTASTAATNAGNSATAAATSATNASNSATSASTSASNASTSATNAAGSASSASTSASNASTSATNAANSASSASSSASTATTQAGIATTQATNAAGSATAAAASFDSFDDRYLGAKTTNPTLDNDGDALLTGALYFNSSAGEMRVYTGSAWVAATVSPDTISEVEFSATAGQTTYVFSSGYRVGFTYIWVNGVMLADADFTASDGTNISFASALALNDEVRIITFKAIGSVSIGDITGLQTALDGKQATLVSGTNIKTINSTSLLGSGDIAIVGAVPYGLFRKADPTIVAWNKTGNFTATTATTLYIEVNGTLHTIASGTSITMPGSATTGTDYAIWCKTDGTLEATTNHTSPPSANARKVGGFHYAPGGNATGTSGGNTTAQINAYSMWDLKFRPACPDPRGMTLVAGGFWSDIYLCGVDHYTNGTSKYNVTMADGSSPPKVPAQFGGNGSTAYSSMNWWEAAEVMRSHGKRLPTYSEFAALAYGTTEASSVGTDQVSTILNAAYTSKWGVIQSSGVLWSWGDEFGGGAAAASWTANTGGRGSTYQMENAVLFGGYWGDGSNSGSRCSYWNLSPTYSDGSIGGRGVCDHLLLD